jgi:hypothetical protein
MRTTTRHITLARAELGRFGPALLAGVEVLAPARTVLGFLVEDLRLDAGYVRDRITTVFLDGEVVDLLDAAMLREGSRLALSAAMPGLVGATLRRGGPLAAMRAEITRAASLPAPAGAPAAPVVIRVKLFNMLVEEIGPTLLERGIVLPRRALAALPVEVDAGPGAPEDRIELRIHLV